MANNPKTTRIKNAAAPERPHAMDAHEGMPHNPEDFPGTWAAQVAKKSPRETAVREDEKTTGKDPGPISPQD